MYHHSYCTTNVRRYENKQVRKNLFFKSSTTYEGYHTLNLRSPSYDCIVTFFFPHVFYLQRIAKTSQIVLTHKILQPCIAYPSPTILRCITMFLSANNKFISVPHKMNAFCSIYLRCIRRVFNFFLPSLVLQSF